MHSWCNGLAHRRCGSHDRTVQRAINATAAGRVGKTSLLSRWTSGNFNDGQLPTQAAVFTAKRISIDGTAVEVAVWDTAGQERFHALGETCSM